MHGFRTGKYSAFVCHVRTDYTEPVQHMQAYAHCTFNMQQASDVRGIDIPCNVFLRVAHSSTALDTQTRNTSSPKKRQKKTLNPHPL